MADLNLRLGSDDRWIYIGLPPELVMQFSPIKGGRLILDPAEARGLARLLDKLADRVEGESETFELADLSDERLSEEVQRRDPKEEDYTDGIVYPYQWKGDD